MENEIWKPIPEYGFWYEISNHGNVRSYIRANGGRRIKKDVPLVLTAQYSEKFAYLSVQLSKGMGVVNSCPIHIIVARTFVKNPKPKKYKYVNHIDGDKLNNYYENLEWCTQGENQKHAYDNGLRKRPNGQLNGRCVLTEDQVLEIFNSNWNMYKLASKYGVEMATILSIRNGRNWSYLTGKQYKPRKLVKLKDKDVLNIYNSKEIQIKLAKKYKVSRSVISGIRTGRCYSNITGKKFVGITEYTYYGIKNNIGRRA
jgi:hypothetical protein